MAEAGATEIGHWHVVKPFRPTAQVAPSVGWGRRQLLFRLHVLIPTAGYNSSSQFTVPPQF